VKYSSSILTIVLLEVFRLAVVIITLSLRLARTFSYC
jgi:hypothetical protein